MTLDFSFQQISTLPRRAESAKKIVVTNWISIECSFSPLPRRKRKKQANSDGLLISALLVVTRDSNSRRNNVYRSLEAALEILFNQAGSNVINKQKGQ